MKLDQDELYDFVVVGSGAGGSVVASRLVALGKKVLILEEGSKPVRESQTLLRPIDQLTRLFYRNAGVIPFFGPFAFPFGEGRVVGGGTYINGGLIWPTPDRILNNWREKMPGSIFDSKTWRETEAKVRKDLKVNTEHNFRSHANLDSQLMHDASLAMKWKSVLVPRAVVQCQNFNRCATGCPSGAKQSMSKTYLKDFEGRGGIILSEAKAVEIRCFSSSGSVGFVQTGQKKKVRFRKLILSAGATESANLLRKNKLSKRAGLNFEFHLNFKVVARFPFELNASNGTIFTYQVQEFEDEGILLMPSNFQEKYIYLGLTEQGKSVFQSVSSRIENLGIFVAMVQPRVRGRVLKAFDQTFGCWNWEKGSDQQVRKALLKLCELLFNAGGEELVLPLRCQETVFSVEAARKAIYSAKIKDFIAVSVHGMSANRMGNSKEESVVDLNGQVWGQENIFVVDSSILPTNTGESPQGTIMTAAHELVDRWIRLKMV